jgi:hypothetical protein
MFHTFLAAKNFQIDCEAEMIEVGWEGWHAGFVFPDNYRLPCLHRPRDSSSTRTTIFSPLGN